MRGDEGGVDDEEEALGLGEEGAVGVMEFSGVEELAAFPAEVAAGEGQGDVQGTGAEVVDLHVAGHGEEVEGAVNFGHSLIHEGGNDAAVDVPGRAFMEAGEGDCGGGGDVRGVVGVEGEVEVQALGVVRTAAEAVVGLLKSRVRSGEWLVDGSLGKAGSPVGCLVLS